MQLLTLSCPLRADIACDFLQTPSCKILRWKCTLPVPPVISGAAPEGFLTRKQLLPLEVQGLGGQPGFHGPRKNHVLRGNDCYEIPGKRHCAPGGGGAPCGVGNDVKKRKNKGAKGVNDYGIFTLAGLKPLNIKTSGKYEGLNARLNSFGALHLPKASLPRLRPFRTPAAHLNPRTLHVPFSDASWALWQRDSLDGCCITEPYQRNLYNSINRRRRHKFNKIKKKKNS